MQRSRELLTEGIMDRFELSFYGTATIIMGLASLFILGGMLIYTSLYRKRGNTEDKLFFALILTNIAAALFICLIYVLAGFGIEPESVGGLVCFLGFFLSVYAFSFLYCLYHMHRMEWKKEKINRMMLLVLVPELILNILLFVSVFTGSLYAGSIVLGCLEIYVYDIFNLAPLIIGGIFAWCISFKRNKKMPVLILIIIATHIFLTLACVINSTPLFLSMYLMLTHFVSMSDSFYGEVA